MADPIEKTEELAQEVTEGRSARTPALAISGVAMAAIAFFLVIGGLAFALYQIF